MQPEGINALTKKAINCALTSSWDEAVEVNKQILELDSNNTDAKIRLGRAYLHTGEFNKAKKILKQVLEIDPVNPIALKNYALAAEHKADKQTKAPIKMASLIKEPGTTTECDFVITTKGVTANTMVPSEVFDVEVKKQSVDLYRLDANNTHLGSIDNENVLKRLNTAKKHGADISAVFISGEDKNMKIMITSSVPVFKSDRQEVRPYIKKGSIEDEPELEIPMEMEDN